MVATLLLVVVTGAHAQEDGPQAVAEHLRGLEVAGAWSPSGVRFEQQFVVGSTGGPSVSTVAARYAEESFAVEAALPLSAFQTPDGRQLGLGNARLGATYALPSDDGLHHVVGLGLHTNIGERSYTWVNDAEQVWPSTGFAMTWQGRTDNAPVTLGYRGVFGMTWPAPYPPFPEQFVTLGAAICADIALRDEIGVVLEGSAAYWELSPVNASVLGRFEVLGATGRAGLVLPLFTWFGASPAEFAGGVTEVVLVADIGMSF